MRTFIAVELPEPAREEVCRLQERLRSCDADVKWVERQNMHFTLKFLGEIDESKADPLAKALEKEVAALPRFRYRLEGIGAFPGTSNPKVLWTGVSSGEAEFLKLAACVEKACEGLGFPPEERPFRPHLTIGRMRSRNGAARLIKQLQTEEFPGSDAEAEQLVLFKSTLSPKGSVYTPLARIPLSSS